MGLDFDENLSWKPHSERLISKLNSVCYQIRILRPVIGLESLLSFYYAQVESRLVYGISFWGSGSMLGDIFIAQKRVLRCMAGVDNRTSCRNIFLRFNVLTVYGLYMLKILDFVHSNISDINKNSDYHSYNTRHRNDISIPTHSLSKVNKTYKIYGLKIHNSLPTEIKVIEDPTIFKKKIKRALLRMCPYTLDDSLVSLASYF